MRLELTNEERSLLRAVVKSRIPEYYIQIRHAMITPFKEELKREKRTLVGIDHDLAARSDRRCVVDWDKSQVSLLDSCLKEAFREKSSELWHTDNSRWRAGIKREKVKLAALQQKVQALAGSSN